MGIIGILVIGIFAFIFMGLLGWIIKIFGWVFEFLWDGCFQTLGCFFWIIIIFLFLIVLA